ncbi:hypothetical protein K503DRAFT_815831 [Rhizopogon vinicolor AM-OR11-026]|uniref:Uncharacterized protein n=1 Tax=Rhizopogon vinicolor AM-OR11-026 TaxID=1314800 RepID=A0A1B7N1U5_9AGAM|nr:hypothetical protein K503DRAFT_815831 [Rhizopogon vinicolor AM-OR11-026]
MYLLSVSSNEEENARSKRAKKPRTREPSWSHIVSPDARQPLLASSQITDSTHKVKTRQPSESRLSAASGFKASSSSLDNDNEISTASVETAATSVSLSIPAARKCKPSVQVQKEETKPKPVRRDLGVQSISAAVMMKSPRYPLLRKLTHPHHRNISHC